MNAHFMTNLKLQLSAPLKQALPSNKHPPYTWNWWISPPLKKHPPFEKAPTPQSGSYSNFQLIHISDDDKDDDENVDLEMNIIQKKRKSLLALMFDLYAFPNPLFCN